VCHVSLDSKAHLGAGGTPPRPPKRLDAQGGRGLAENLAELPSRCARGAKRSPRGQMWTWCGFKFHLTIADGGLPTARKTPEFCKKPIC
jgi:hypothetical protein